MNFNVKNKEDWIQIQKELFPIAIPKHAEWTKIGDIVKVLNIISSKKLANYMLYPRSGGGTLTSAKVSFESNCIEFICQSNHLIKPNKIIFESFEDPMWSYFRIETDELESTGVCEDNDSTEDVVEFSDGNYISSLDYDSRINSGEMFSEYPKKITRHLKGAFVIFAKKSDYNKNTSTTDGRHNTMNSDEFRDYIENVIGNGL